MTETTASEAGEFDFPPVPTILPLARVPNAYEDQLPPPLPLIPPPLEHLINLNKNEFLGDECEDFPPPPSADYLSPLLQTISPESGRNDSKDKDFQVNKESSVDRETKVDDESTGHELPSYFSFLTSRTKPPFFKRSAEADVEITQLDKPNELSDSTPLKISINQKPFAKLIKRLGLEEKAIEDDLKKTEDNVKFNHDGENSKALSDSMIPNGEPLENGFPETIFPYLIDEVPPPMFGSDDEASPAIPPPDSARTNPDGFRRAQEQPPQNGNLNNFSREHYEDSGRSDHSDRVDPEAVGKQTIANAHLPKNLIFRDGSTTNKQSLDARLGGLKSLISDGDVKGFHGKNNCAIISDSVVQAPNQHKSKFGKDESDDQSQNSCGNFQNIKSQVARGDSESCILKGKVSAPIPTKTFKLVKAPRVVHYSEDQIKSVGEALKLTNSNEISNGSRTESMEVTFPKKSFMSEIPGFEAANQVEESMENKCSDIADLSDREQIEIVANNGPAITFYHCTNKIQNNGNPDSVLIGNSSTEQAGKTIVTITSEAPKCPPKAICQFLAKCPNMKGLTDDQTENMIQPNDAINFGYEKNQENQSQLRSNSNTTIIQNEEGARIKNVRERVQDVRNFFEETSKDVNSPIKVPRVKRSKSAASLLMKPVHVGQTSKEVGSSLKGVRDIKFEEFKVNASGVENAKSVEADRVDSDKVNDTLGVSQAKAFFEHFKQTQNKNKSNSKLLQKASTFSINKSNTNPQFLKMKEKYQNRADTIDELQLDREEKILPKQASSLDGVVINEDLMENGSVDEAPQLPVGSLVTKFGVSRKVSNKKATVLDNCVAPKKLSKPPGKSLSNPEAKFQKYVPNQSQNNHTWRSFLQTYSES